MLIKSFSQLSRHAALSKSILANRNSSTQPAFFVSTSQLPRFQAQIVVKGSAPFGPEDYAESEDGYQRNAPALAGGLASATSFTSPVPVLSLDDERQQNRAEAQAQAQAKAHSRTASSSVRKVHSISKNSDGLRHKSVSRYVHTSTGNSPVTRRRRHSTSSDGPHEQLDLQHLQQQLRMQESPSEETNETSADSAPVNPGPEAELTVASTEDSTNGSITAPTTQATSTLTESLSPTLSDSSLPLDQRPDYILEMDRRIADVAALQDHATVLDTLDSLTMQDMTPTLASYNHALASAAALCRPGNSGSLSYDLTPMLEIYSDMLSRNVLPDMTTYSTILRSLLDASSFRTFVRENGQLIVGDRLQMRHRTLLPPAERLVENVNQAQAYTTLALNMFVASNAAISRRYPTDIYRALLQSSVENRVPEYISAVMRHGGDLELTSAEDKVLLMRGYVQLRDAKRAVRAYGDLKQSLKSGSSPLALQAYRHLVEAHFANGDELGAVRFFEKVVASAPAQTVASPDFEPVVAAIVLGFCGLNDFDTAWRWIKKVDADAEVAQLSVASLARVFSRVASAAREEGIEASSSSSSSLIGPLFDYIASRADSTTSTAFNDVRSDYLMWAMAFNHRDTVLKLVRESQLRSGVWDHTTLAATVSYLLNESSADLSDLALNLFHAQAGRLSQHIRSLDLPPAVELVDLGEECIEKTAEALQLHDKLDARAALLLATCAFATPTLLKRAAGTAILEAIWAARQANTPAFRDLHVPTGVVTLDILALHHSWIKLTARSDSDMQPHSDGLLSAVRHNYGVFVSDALDMGLQLAPAFAADVEACLEVLELGEVLARFTQVRKEHQVTKERPKEQLQIEMQNHQTPGPEFNIAVSNQIIGYAQSRHGLFTSLEMLQQALAQGDAILPEAFATVIEAAGTAGKPQIIRVVYDEALRVFPHPSYSANAWGVWRTIHQAVVRSAAESDLALARAAHVSLLEMGSAPDATGYGLLIGHSQAQGSHDEASDATALFSQAMVQGVRPTTDLYNALLSKLSKARRLKEALGYFNHMAETGTAKNSVSYSTLISACCRSGDEDMALRLFAEMEATPDYMPHVAPFNTMLQYYVHSKPDRGAALAMYQRLRLSGVRLSSHTYKLLIDAYATIEPVDIAAAENVLSMIIKDGNMVAPQHYAALIFSRGVCLKDFEGCRALYRSLIKNNRVRPNHMIMQAMLESYVVCGHVQQTSEVLNDMVRFDVHMNAYMANALIRGWAPVDLAKSVSMFESLLQQGLAEPSSYESIVRAFLFHGDVTSAGNVIQMMRINGYPEPVVSKIESFVATYTAIRPGHSEILAYQDELLLLDSMFRQDVNRLNLHREE